MRRLQNFIDGRFRPNDAANVIPVDFTADYIDYMAEWARRIEGEILPSDRVINAGQVCNCAA